MSKPRILALGPNPAWQKTLFFPDFRFNEVNRARRCETCASGKGINFVRAARCHGSADAEVLQFAGGSNGERLERFLADEGLPFTSVRSAAETRCCITCLGGGDRSMTELIEPSGPISREESDALLELFRRKLADGAAGAAFCGTTPDGTDPGFYAKAVKFAAAARIPLLIDAFRGIDEILTGNAAIVLKINREELALLTGTEGIADGLRKLFASAPALRFAAITDGPGTACAADGCRFVAYTLPRLDGIVNPIGCGDTASAVLLSGFVAGGDPFRAFRQALGAASANALNAFPGHFERGEEERIAAAIRLEEYSLREAAR